MLALIAFGPSVIVIIIAIVLLIKLRKNDNPGKLAVIFSVIALVCGLIHLMCQLYPFEYKGEGGIDYIGQAIVWSITVKSILYATLAAYVSFAIVATVFAVKALKAKETRKKGILSLILSWVYGIVFASLIITNIAADKANKKSIKVEVREVTQVTDTEGDSAVLIQFEIYNGTKRDITFQSSVYAEISQNGKQIYHTNAPGWEEYRDADIKDIKPGSSAEIRNAYKLNDKDAPVRISCRTYAGDVTYLDGEFMPK